MAKPRTSPSNPGWRDGAVITTLGLPRDLWIAVKTRGVHEQRTLVDICRRALLAYLATPLQPNARPGVAGPATTEEPVNG